MKVAESEVAGMKVIFLKNIILGIIITSSISYANNPINGKISSLSELENILNSKKIPLQDALITIDLDDTLLQNNLENKKQTTRVESEIKGFQSKEGENWPTMASRIINSLKNQGAKVIGLTGRESDSDKSTKTIKKLEKLGITFSEDFNNIKFIRDSTTEFKNQKADESIPFINGILYTNQNKYILAKKPLTEEECKKVKHQITIDGKNYEFINADKGAFLERFLEVVKKDSSFIPSAVILVDDNEHCCQSFMRAFTPPKENLFEIIDRNFKSFSNALKSLNRDPIFKPKKSESSTRYACFLASFQFNENIEIK